MKDLKKGILVAADHNIEWMVPWWWNCYSRYNQYPVIFIDLGMTEAMKKWCQQKGEYRVLEENDFITQQSDLPKETRKIWENIYLGDLWKARQGWFKKPLACLQTVFDLTVWIDVDCEICGDLTPLFNEWCEGIELALVNDERSSGQPNFSSGVILFYKNAPFLKTWAEKCLNHNSEYMGDQNILTEMILNQNIPIKELNPIYNWIMYQGANIEALILHWGGGWGKQYIKKYGGIHQFLNSDLL